MPKRKTHLSKREWQDKAGFDYAQCTCGHRIGPVPGTDIILDAMMEHAAAAADAWWRQELQRVVVSARPQL